VPSARREEEKMAGGANSRGVFFCEALFGASGGADLCEKGFSVCYEGIEVLEEPGGTGDSVAFGVVDGESAMIGEVSDGETVTHGFFSV